MTQVTSFGSMFAMFASAYETGSKTLVADQSKVTFILLPQC